MKLKSGIEINFQRVQLNKYNLNYRKKGDRWNTLAVSIEIGKEVRSVMVERKLWRKAPEMIRLHLIK